ncbi:MAG: shikimate dehydrogenase [Gammaproteobacteria bacterium]|nr:shikimate dehydrogenase [Gammaproteobacteria bacterium]
MSDRYAVMGHPVSHSRSPFIHGQFAAQTGQDIDYTAIDVEPGSFVDAVKQFQAQGGKGLNVTVPYKQEAWQLVDTRSHRAELAGAVNTIRMNDDGSLYGDNTDGIGLLRDLTLNLDMTLHQKRILVLGAGGAVRGVLVPLLEQGPKQLTIANRTVEKAVELAKVFGSIAPVEPAGFEQLAGQSFDIIINGTAASLGGELPPVPDSAYENCELVYDMMYAREPTPFMAHASKHGVGAVDGLGMLVEQAAESFYVWRGVMPDTAPVIAAVRRALSGA